MTPRQKQIMRETWTAVEPHKEYAARLFYDRLFEIDPSTRRMFGHVDMTAQSNKLMTAISGVVQGLDHFQILKPTIQDLGRRHADYGVIETHYDSVGSALLWTLRQTLGACWTVETKQAWSDGYRLIAETMLDGARRQVTKKGAMIAANSR